MASDSSSAGSSTTVERVWIDKSNPAPYNPSNPRSKKWLRHRMINSLIDWIEFEFGEEGRDIHGREVTEGFKNVVRVDLKSGNFEDVQPILVKIDKQTTITGVSTRLSMKKKKQYKGISVYLKFDSLEEVAKCSLILEQESGIDLRFQDLSQC